MLLFVAVGAVVVWVNGEGRRRGASWTRIYSLDHLLSIIRLELHGAARCYIYFHTLVGYVLASFVLAGFAGLTE